MATVKKPILDEEHVPGISGLVDLDAISDALNKETWDELLNDEERTRLRAFLPGAALERRCGLKVTDEQRATSQDAAINDLFSGKVFFFDSPLSTFHRQLRAGRFSADMALQIRERQQQLVEANTKIATQYHSRLFAGVIRGKRSLLGEASVQLDLSRIVNKCLVRKRKKKSKSAGGKVASSAARDDSDFE